jgi:DNA topoisomerase-2
MTELTIDGAINQYYKDYAMYVIGNRAIPSMIDGLKPVQRKILCAAIDKAKNKKIKVAELGGMLSSYGYHHGETSAQDAVVGMAQEWNNNITLLEAHGNFGSRIVQEAAAPRYIFTKLSENYSIWFKDTDIAPKTSDPEDLEPLHYLPIIPMVLVNGARGIAVGFATNILPRDPNEILKACRKVLNGTRNIKAIPPSYPGFKGTWRQEDGKWIATGEWSNERGGYRIRELPPGTDREKYVTHLTKLADAGDIGYFEDHCSDVFNFFVKVTPTQKKAIEKKGVEKVFKLSTSFTENITVLDQNNELKVYDNEIDLIRDFCKYRILKIRERLDNNIIDTINDIAYNERMLAFVKEVSKDRKKVLDSDIRYLTSIADKHSKTAEETKKMVNMPIYKFCSETIDQLVEKIKIQQKHLVEIKKLEAFDVYLDELY